MEETFYQMMADFDFSAQLPTLMNAGRRLGQLARALFFPSKTAWRIFDALKNAR
jgi:ribonucleoside-diphosphate reductase alpha chain